MPMTLPGAVASGHYFSPRDTGVTTYWWDATRANSLTDAGAGHISDWQDFGSGAGGFFMSNATDANRPISGTRTQNSKNVLDFNGTTQNLAGGGFLNTFTLAQPFTIYIVCLNDDGANSTRQVVIDRIATGVTIEKTAANVWAINAGTALASATAPTTAAQYFTAQFNGGFGSVLRRNGTQIASGDAGTNTLSSSGFQVGSLGAGGASFWNGWIGEVIVSSAADSASIVSQMETYLSKKWNI